MTSHTRLSPGYEFQEIDRSQYADQPDGSVTDTAVWMAGFADRGPDYQTTWVNSMQTYLERYGAPTNELEKYLYNGAEEIIGRGGRCLVSKLPYDNVSKDMFSYVEYGLDNMCSSRPGLWPDEQLRLEQLSSVDPSLTSYMNIYPYPQFSENRFSVMQLDDLIVGRRSSVDDRIQIVDVTRQKYGKFDMKGAGHPEDECLGMLPVIVAAGTAMFFQRVISSHEIFAGQTYETENISAWQPVCDVGADDLGHKSLHFGDYPDKLATQISASAVNGDSVANRTVSVFPYIGFSGQNVIDRYNLKRIGLVVFEIRPSEGDDSKLDFIPTESFFGSLDRNAKNESGGTDYIGDIVNSQSRLVRFFFKPSQTRGEQLRQASILVSSSAALAKFDGEYVTTQHRSYMLGFFERECAKTPSYEKSVAESLNRALSRIEDPNKVRIDIVCDCGLANIAQWIKDSNESNADVVNASVYPFMSDDGTWNFRQPSAWRAVADKLDTFAKTRKDCLFVSDGPRPLVLKGNEKTVRLTDPESSIERDIIPNLRYVQGLNSNRSCGYLNWYLVGDAYSGDRFWCPPSVKAAGVMVYTDAYHHTWDAPAGLNRGGVRGALDVSFDPQGDEAGRIYEQAWNYAVSYPLEGIVVEGQKTFQRTKTALDRINVRRLMLWLERRVAAKARRFLYEGNTQYLRQKFVDSIRTDFEDAKNGAGIIDYAIRCDESLNTADVIDRNEMRCICAVRPVKTVEWIRIDFIITNQSASVSEEVMRD